MRQITIRSQGKWYWRADYLGWSLACAIAWAVIWVLVATLATTNTVHAFAYVFLGWVIGWGMAALARVIYPAPKRTLLTRERHNQAPGGYPRA
jgi:hypothetical protein